MATDKYNTPTRSGFYSEGFLITITTHYYGAGKPDYYTVAVCDRYIVNKNSGAIRSYKQIEAAKNAGRKIAATMSKAVAS